MSFLKSLTAAAVIAILPTFSAAGTIGAGDYNVVDLDGFRSIWTPNGNSGPNGHALVTGGHASSYWSFSDTILSFDGENASINGRATNTGANELAFDLSLNFALTETQNGYCQFSKSEGGVGKDVNCDKIDYSTIGVDPSSWTYLDFLDGTFAGVEGSVMEDIVYNISDNANHRPQLGYGANALEKEDFGFSMWFMFDLDGNSPLSAMSAFSGDTYAFNSSGRGDINVDVSAVPLPAAGWLLLASIGGLAAAKRRRAA